jgi:NAD(P)H dehydrogenase (quinone)
MNVLIVHAHPEPKSFSAAMCNAAREQLGEQGHQVQVSDLYASGFNPIASEADFAQRQDPAYLNYALEQRHAQKAGGLAPDIESELAKLLWSDLLILNFPVFWCAPPAIMKGWFDRVLVSGQVYGGKRFYDRGGLVGKRALVAATIGGQSDMFESGGIHGPIEQMLRPVLQGTLGYAGMQVLPPFMAWHVPYIDDDARAALLLRYRDHLSRLDQVAPLVFPSLDDFDSRLYPQTVSVE